ncbi:MAG: recombinase family protein [Mesorhizobium sp.]|nr:MAG: recombinase family protein [Mesorhizobium sp.]TKB80674.1 MAG: recombinase family protein [Mesorhizobium sp.]
MLAPLTAHVYAALAEKERRQTSERTRAALAARKERGPSWAISERSRCGCGLHARPQVKAVA